MYKWSIIYIYMIHVLICVELSMYLYIYRCIYDVRMYVYIQLYI